MRAVIFFPRTFCDCALIDVFSSDESTLYIHTFIRRHTTLCTYSHTGILIFCVYLALSGLVIVSSHCDTYSIASVRFRSKKVMVYVVRHIILYIHTIHVCIDHSVAVGVD